MASIAEEASNEFDALVGVGISGGSLEQFEDSIGEDLMYLVAGAVNIKFAYVIQRVGRMQQGPAIGADAFVPDNPTN